MSWWTIGRVRGVRHQARGAPGPREDRKGRPEQSRDGRDIRARSACGELQRSAVVERIRAETAAQMLGLKPIAGWASVVGDEGGVEPVEACQERRRAPAGDGLVVRGLAPAEPAVLVARGWIARSRTSKWRATMVGLARPQPACRVVADTLRSARHAAGQPGCRTGRAYRDVGSPRAAGLAARSWQRL